MNSYISDLYANWKENILSEEIALRQDLAGMRFFDMPICGVSDAEDPLFQSLKEGHIVGAWHKLPEDWMRGVKPKRVISLFFPFSEQVKKMQRLQTEEATPEWLHGRIEGHEAMLRFTEALRIKIEKMGYNAVIPAMDPECKVVMASDEKTDFKKPAGNAFGSNWSERHVAYISGLGTFGLSRGLITERGMAGRFCSIVTDMPIPVTERPYEKYDEWCTRCGACVKRCPVHAITLEHGKDHGPCGKRINESKIRYAPRYGCGQCQTRVPCESKRP